MPRRRAVLVVSDDAGLVDEVGGWLEDSGREVLTCPGPSRGGCVGLAGRGCALERAAGVVVLDLHPRGDAFLDETRRTELVEHYSGSGHPALAPPGRG